MKTPLILCALATLSLTACTQKTVEPAVPASPPPPLPAVTVNGKAISQKTFEFYAASLARKPYAELSPEDREQIRENLVRMELFAQAADKNGLLQDPELVAALEVARLQLIQQNTAQRIAKEGAPTDAELHAEYDTQVAALPQIEIRARHIVLDSEAAAQQAIDRIQAGANFAALARQISRHPESARQGGELGWFPATALGPEFAQAVSVLKKGQVTPHPAKSRMGWHVVQLEDTRASQPPPFDQVKEQLTKFVLTKKLSKASDELLKVAKVEPPLTTDAVKELLATPTAPVAPASPAAAPSPEGTAENK